jgi:hypothetical protein
MNEITALFTGIGDFFTQSDWWLMVRWPFWILLFTVAAGGVYCAKFGKKALASQGISCTMSLIALYLLSAIACTQLPTWRNMFGYLPFLDATDTAVSLVNPLNLSPNNYAAEILKLILLVIMLDGADAIITGKGWLLWRCAAYGIALLFYTALTAFVDGFFPCIFSRFAIIPVVLIISLGIVMMCAKFIFTSVISGGNSYYTKVHKFFTGNKLGIIFTTSSLTFLLALAAGAALILSKNTVLTYDGANHRGLWIILGLLFAGMYIFDRFFIDRTKS